MSILFSIVIPAHNEEAVIGRCLESLEAMDYARERYEVIVVDDASTDRTAEIARSHAARVITQDCSSIAEVRNLGVRHSSGEIVAHLDADMVVDPRWLSRAEEHFADGLTGALYFKEDVPAEAPWIARIWYGPFRADKSRVRRMDYLASCNLFVRRELHDEVGGLDEDLSRGRKGGSDKEYTYRIGRLGYPLLSDPSLHMLHLGYEKSLAEFLRKEFWRQGNSLFLARKFGYPMRLLRAPLISLWHLMAMTAFVLTFIFGGLSGPAGVFAAAWLAPSLAIVLRRMDLARYWHYVPAVWFVTFVRWSVAGVAMAPQLWHLIAGRRAAS